MKSHQLTEVEFYGIVYDFILGVNATACSERIGVGVKSVRTKYKKLRQRVGNDPKISGPLAALPPEDDPIWKALHFCIFECCGNVDEDYKLNPHNIGMFLSSKYVGKDVKVIGKKRKIKCDKCPLDGPFEMNENLHYTLQLQRTTMNGYGKDSFRNYYIEGVLRSIALQNRGKKSTSFNQYAKAVLDSCYKDPL